MSTMSVKERCQQFSSLLGAVEKQINISIKANDFKILKLANYKICVAKKVGNEDYNVVWSAYDRYFQNSMLKWTPQYQIFGTNSFQAGVQVATTTNIVNIKLQEKVTLNSFGILSDPISGGPDTGFIFENEYGSVHTGVNQLVTDFSGKQTANPIYVSQNPIVQGNCTLTPVEKVLVWFEQNVETSTMFSTSRSKSIELDLTNRNSIIAKYENQVWSIE